MNQFLYQLWVLELCGIRTLELGIQAGEAFLQRIFWARVDHLFADRYFIAAPVNEPKTVCQLLFCANKFPGNPVIRLSINKTIRRRNSTRHLLSKCKQPWIIGSLRNRRRVIYFHAPRVPSCSYAWLYGSRAISSRAPGCMPLGLFLL